MPEPSPRVSPAFLVVTFVVGAVVAVAIAYLGIHGQLGGPIP
jgi:small basic protein